MPSIVVSGCMRWMYQKENPSNNQNEEELRWKILIKANFPHKKNLFAFFLHHKVDFFIRFDSIMIWWFCIWIHVIYAEIYTRLNSGTFNHQRHSMFNHKISFNKPFFFLRCVLFICESEPIIPNLTIWCFHRPYFYYHLLLFDVRFKCEVHEINATQYFIAFNSLKRVRTDWTP